MMSRSPIDGSDTRNTSVGTPGPRARSIGLLGGFNRARTSFQPNVVLRPRRADDREIAT